MLTPEDLKAIGALIAQQLAPVNSRLDDIGQCLEAMGQRLDKLEQRFDKLEQRVGKVELRLDKVESEVSSLKVGQMQMMQEIRNISKKVNATYELALDNWGQIVESKKRLDILEA